MREPDANLLQSVERYYSARLAEHGATPRGVDWNSPESQAMRFDQLAKLWDEDGVREIDVIDYGCGYGALVDYLSERGVAVRYQGFDISDAMVREAQSRVEATGASARPRFTTDSTRLEKAEYVIASGIFNVKLTTDDSAWQRYMQRTIDGLAALATRGFAFNALTSYSDADRRRGDLHYADPLYWFDYCKKAHSRFVTLLHDYPLYEFTLLVRMRSQ
jgi:SAM-dependent methyltransferase